MSLDTLIVLAFLACLYLLWVFEVGQFVSFGRGCEKPFDWSEDG